MQTHTAKRIEITIEAPMQRRLTEALQAADITGYTLLPVLGGSGRSGEWSREGQISSAGGMVQLICILREEKLEQLLEAVLPVLNRHIGVVCVTDCEVLRAERF